MTVARGPSSARHPAGSYGPSAPAATALVGPWTARLVDRHGQARIAVPATAPTMVTGMGLVQSRTPAGRLNEGLTLAVTTLLTGIAAGSATGGWTAEHLPFPAAGCAVPAAAAALSLAVTATATATAARRA
ncbi:hypothetical protein [Streptomyces noursei]|uniref:hypothetical protein n=1 Tax=Streptomyces noursei TaxID=1971 RepID=UPI003BF4A769